MKKYKIDINNFQLNFEHIAPNKLGIHTYATPNHQEFPVKIGLAFEYTEDNFLELLEKTILDIFRKIKDE